jgi:hypothetical protein
MRVSDQLDLDALVPTLIQGLLCAAERHWPGLASC